MGFDKAKAIRAAEKYLAQGKISSALQEYQRIVGADAGDFAALNTVGDLYARLDMKSEAVACYRRVAEHYREQGFTLKAIAMYKKLTRFGAEDHQTAVALARLYEQQGLMAEARAQYMVAADASARSGQTREALEVLQRIADLDPANTQVRLRLAEAYTREDLPELARLVTFRPFNLMSAAWSALGEPFDVVFCRNVMIYFDNPTQRRVLERMHAAMRPGALLYVGHSENFTDARELFRLRGKTIYERL